MKVLLLGSGGREHALAWKMAQSPLCEKLFIAPGNSGTASLGTNVAIRDTDFPALEQLVREQAIDLIVVGPEAPLVAGVYDYFAELGIPVIGPSKAGAQLEGSKAFSKKFMQRHAIPTASYFEADASNIEEAFLHLENSRAPYVLKADGLAAGKGVLIIQSLEGAKFELREMIEQSKFGSAGSKVVIEEFLDGIEFSVFVLSDGTHYCILPEAKDYKRIGEGDTGLNTGGMGAISPVPFVDAALMKKVDERIIQPTIRGLKEEQIIYRGFIYIGLILVKGEPFVIEYNCRMGDPETEVVMPRLKSDLLRLFNSVSTEQLDKTKIELENNHALTVILASDGYPGDFEKDKEIGGLNQIGDAMLFHASARVESNKVLSNGGRVLAVTAIGTSLKEAQQKAMKAAAQISFANKYYRGDIGYEFI